MSDAISPGPPLGWSIFITTCTLIGLAAASIACIVILTWYVRMTFAAAVWAWHTQFWRVWA